ncbi:MAG TPA: STAS domain-containing protein [Nocardioidaceae bacterium]|nr:STAS domain-containing protein [Nocardioidaceae bacterium]
MNEVFATRPAATICQYQRQRFDHALLSSVRGLHTDQLGAETEANVQGGGSGLSLTALPDGTGLHIDGEADLATRAALHAALSALDAEVVHLRLAGLRFIDAGCLTEIMALAQPPRHLVLHDPPRIMQRMMDLMWPGNAVEKWSP